MNVIIGFLQAHFSEVLLFIIGCLFICGSIKSLIITLLSVNWVKTKGIILESYLTSDADGGYFINLKFSYTVNGRHYLSTRIYPPGLPVSNNKKAAEAEMRPIGQEIEIYYNPRNSKEACLYVNQNYVTIILLVVAGIIFITIAILIYLKVTTIDFESMAILKGRWA